MLQDLAERGVARLLVEGGARVLGDFLAAGRADELNLAVAPFFLGDPAPATAPRLNLPAPSPASPMTLAETRRVGEVALLRYLLGPGGPDHRFLRWAVRALPAVPAVGFGVLRRGGRRRRGRRGPGHRVLPRAGGPRPRRGGGASASWHGKLGPDPRLRHATLYSSLVPCGARASRPVTCVGHIVAAGIPRVVFAWREPRLFTDGEGAEQLRAAGVAVTEVPELAERARAVNAHLVGTGA